MISSLIIDDEKKAATGLQAQLARVAPGVEVVGTAQTVTAAYDLVQSTRPDLVFLDIMLLDGTGFELLQRFETVPFATIFTTAFDEYAIQAFRFSAVDYLLKPISADELAEAVQRMQAQQRTVSRQNVQRLMKNTGLAPEHRKLAIHEVTGIRYVSVGSIVRLEAESNYSRFILDDGSNILATRSLKNYAELLAGLGFFRCHKSFLVNLRHLTRYRKSKKPVLEMSDGTEIPVARNAREALLSQMEQWSV